MRVVIVVCGWMGGDCLRQVMGGMVVVGGLGGSLGGDSGGGWKSCWWWC